MLSNIVLHLSFAAQGPSPILHSLAAPSLRISIACRASTRMPRLIRKYPDFRILRTLLVDGSDIDARTLGVYSGSRRQPRPQGGTSAAHVL
jgi:hypothetical protein